MVCVVSFVENPVEYEVLPALRDDERVPPASGIGLPVERGEYVLGLTRDELLQISVNPFREAVDVPIVVLPVLDGLDDLLNLLDRLGVLVGKPNRVIEWVFNGVDDAIEVRDQLLGTLDLPVQFGERRG